MSNGLNVNDIILKITENFAQSEIAQGKFNSSSEKLFLVTGQNEGDTITLGDDSGDRYQISSEDAKEILGLSDEEFARLMEESETVNPVADPAAANGVTATGTADEIQAEIDALEDQKAANESVMEGLKARIEELHEAIELKIEEALEEMEEITKEEQAQAQEIVEQNLRQFEEDKANGVDTDPSKLSQNIRTAMAVAGIGEAFTKSLCDILEADTDLALMDGLLTQLNSRIQVGKELDTEIQSKNVEKEAAEAAEAAASKSCDPIGFQMDDGIQVDFFVDADGDNQINDVTDFLGAKDTQDGWNEMAALDGANGEKAGVIESEELEAANVKVMVTNANGEQVAMTISEFEEQYGNLEINAKKDAQIDGTVEGPNGFEEDERNQMLGTFSLSVDGEELKGYQTLDSTEWLNEHYDITNGIEGAPETVGTAGGATNEALQEFEEFAKRYEEEVMPQLEQDIQDAYAQLNVDKTLVDATRKAATAAGASEALKIEEEFKEQEADEIAQKALEREAAKAEAVDEAVEEAEVDGVDPEAAAEEAEDLFDWENNEAVWI